MSVIEIKHPDFFLYVYYGNLHESVAHISINIHF